jgi:hypothetical protein
MNWYARFEAFRLAGPQRSLIDIYHTERANAGKRAAQKVPGSWTETAKKWNWYERVEAWDVYQLGQQRAAAEQAYRQALEEHQQRARTFSEQAHEASTRMLALLSQRLAAMPVEDLAPAGLASWARAAAHVGAASVEARSEVLTVDNLLALLQEQPSGNEGGSI